MGTWGPGVFDNDAARDHLFDLMQGLAEHVDEALSDAECAGQSNAEPELVRQTLAELLEIVLPNVEIICVLHESLTGGFLPEPTVVEGWLERFERLSPLGSHLETNSVERQTVIQQTFNRLIQHCRRCWDDDQTNA